MVGDLAPPGSEGAAVGLYRTAGDLGFIVGPLMMGMMADVGAFAPGFAVSGAFLLAAALLVTRIPETRRTEGEVVA